MILLDIDFPKQLQNVGYIHHLRLVYFIMCLNNRRAWKLKQKTKGYILELSECENLSKHWSRELHNFNKRDMKVQALGLDYKGKFRVVYEITKHHYKRIKKGCLKDLTSSE